MPEQQIVEIAKAIGADAKVVIMDEPTASLATHEVERLFRIIARLRRRAPASSTFRTVCEEVFAIADRITVLRDGETVGDPRRPARSTREEVDAADGRARAERDRGRCARVRRATSRWSCASCRIARSACATCRCRCARGEILGLAGLVGSGRTELAETLFGLAPATGGEVRLRGAAAHIAVAARCAFGWASRYVPEDRRRHGVVLEMPIAANAAWRASRGSRGGD